MPGSVEMAFEDTDVLALFRNQQWGSDAELKGMIRDEHSPADCLFDALRTATSLPHPPCITAGR